jgi:lambda repressor-like predicted transcriptional regulator
MTENERSETTDLGALGLSGFQESINELSRKYQTPRDEGEAKLTDSERSELVQEIEDLKQEIKEFQEEKSLLDYFTSLKADENQKIGDRTINLKLWQALPKEERPQKGDAYLRIYNIKKRFDDELMCYAQPGTVQEIRRLDALLGELSYEADLIKSHSHDQTNSKYIHYTWTREDNQIFGQSKIRKPPKRWADCSSSDEDEHLSAAIQSLTTKSENKSPGIILPKDFDECFPMLGDRLTKICTHYGWDKTTDDSCELKRQGLISFEEKADGTIIFDVENNERLALLSLYAFVGAFFLKPQELAKENSTEVALTFMCSIIAKEQLAKGDHKDLLSIALKNGDGGKAVFRNRLFFLTKSSDSGVKLILAALEKLASKFARELQEDQLDEETRQAVTDRAFTSIEGMLANSYRKTKRPVYEERYDPVKRKKAPVVVSHKTSVSLPDLATSRMPLKPSELTKAEALRSKFNDRRSEVKRRLDRMDSSNAFLTPKVCKEVATEAYAKLSPLRMILKSRTTKIRDLATKNNNGQKPGPGDWATATTQVLLETPEIGEEVWSYLSWESG